MLKVSVPNNCTMKGNLYSGKLNVCPLSMDSGVFGVDVNVRPPRANISEVSRWSSQLQKHKAGRKRSQVETDQLILEVSKVENVGSQEGQ